MFLYNILTGGSSKQQQSKYDKISFKINLSDNIPQYYEYNSSDNNHKHLHYQEDQQLTPKHPMWGKVFANKNNLDQQPEENCETSQTTTIRRRIFDMENREQNIKSTSTEANNQNNAQSNNSTDNVQPSQSQLLPNPNYHFYRTTQNDTLFGIALKLDIRQQQIQLLNDISERLYEGMTIKLPIHCDVSKLYDQPEGQLSKVKISEILCFEATNMIETEKFDTEYYAGLAGYIKGTLSINKNYVIFNPNLDDPTNLQKYSDQVQKLLKFNAIVETIDIQDISYIQISEMTDSQSNIEKIQNPEHNHIIQIFLYIVGNSKIEKKYKERLTKLKTQKKAIASISFSLRVYKNLAKQKCQKIIQKLKDILRRLEEQEQASGMNKKQTLPKIKEKKRLTNIPFFDIIHENLHPRIKEQMESIVMTPEKSAASFEPISPSLACGILTETSDIISDGMFHNLSFSLPLMYQQCNWTRIYSSTLNGCSFLTFLTRTKDEYPLILLIKEYKGWKLGAFLCQSIQTGKTGRGQMFIFTFKNDMDFPEVYKWTTKNEFFVYVEKDSGIGIGMGVKYGLFLKNTIDKGSSAASFTFGNTQPLSKKEDFTVEEVQVWAVDNSY